MTRLGLCSAILVAFISALVIYSPTRYLFLDIVLQKINDANKNNNTTLTFAATSPTLSTSVDTIHPPMIKSAAAAVTMPVLRHASIKPHRSSTRGHSDHGWLNTYHSFSFADWYNPDFNHFGALRVLNEDRVKANSGFPTHPHRDFEIFSYILSGELTHRDSMLAKGKEGGQSDKFYRMHRGDVQFTTGGTGIAHSEFNEHKSDTVHFLQIWAIPWKKGLAPRYHTRHFDDEEKRKGFVKILSPLKGGVDASAKQETDAEPTVANTIPIHTDLVMGAGLIRPSSKFEWVVGGGAGIETKRKVFVHLAMTQKGNAKIRLDGRDDVELAEGDGAFIESVSIGDKLAVESIGEAEAEVVVLDTA